MARDLVGELLAREKSMSTQAAPVTNSAQNYDLADKLLARESSMSKTNKMLTSANASPQEGMVASITNSAPFNFVLGAGDALKNTIGGAASLLPGVNINPAKSGEGTAYDVGNIAGNIGGFVGGGEALDALRFAGEGIPLVGALAKQLGGNGLRGAARRAIGTGIAGAAENLNDQAGGAEKGAAISLAFDAIPGAVRGLGKAAELVNPRKFTRDLVNSIKQSYEASTKKAAKEYTPVLDKLGNEKITNAPGDYLTLYHGTTPESSEKILSKGLQPKEFSKDYATLTNKPTAALEYSTKRMNNEQPGSVIKIKIPLSDAKNYLHEENSDWATQALKPRGEEDAQIFGIKQPIPAKYIERASDNDLLLNPEVIKINDKPSDYSGLDKDLIKDYFTPDLKKMHARYVENPTLQNAHDLQSQIFTRMGKLSSKKPDAFTSNTVEALRQARDALRNDITSYLKNTSPELASKYAKGTNIFREEVSPFRENPTVFKIASGKKQTIEPQQLEKSLTNLKENRQLSDKHYLSQALEQLSQRISRGNAAKIGVPMVAGGILGQMLAPGIGGVAGAISGSALGAAEKIPSAIDLATNPVAIKAMQSLKTPYNALVKSLIANKLKDN